MHHEIGSLVDTKDRRIVEDYFAKCAFASPHKAAVAHAIVGVRYKKTI